MPNCSTPNSVEVLTDVKKEYRNSNSKPFSVEGLVFFHCTACGEHYINPEADKLNAPKIWSGQTPERKTVCRLKQKIRIRLRKGTFLLLR
jgi:hypothetical protein